MPLIRIRRHPHFPRDILQEIVGILPSVAAPALSCPEGGELKPEDIIIEVEEAHELDRNPKHLHIRVIAHDYASRRENLEKIRKDIALGIFQHIPNWAKWFVWVLLSPTAYGDENAF